MKLHFREITNSAKTLAAKKTCNFMKVQRTFMKVQRTFMKVQRTFMKIQCNFMKVRCTFMKLQCIFMKLQFREITTSVTPGFVTLVEVFVKFTIMQIIKPGQTRNLELGYRHVFLKFTIMQIIKPA